MIFEFSKKTVKIPFLAKFGDPQVFNWARYNKNDIISP
jgi:hypothetical protein